MTHRVLRRNSAPRPYPSMGRNVDNSSSGAIPSARHTHQAGRPSSHRPSQAHPQVPLVIPSFPITVGTEIYIALYKKTEGLDYGIIATRSLANGVVDSWRASCDERFNGWAVNCIADGSPSDIKSFQCCVRVPLVNLPLEQLRIILINFRPRTHCNWLEDVIRMLIHSGYMIAPYGFRERGWRIFTRNLNNIGAAMARRELHPTYEGEVPVFDYYSLHQTGFFPL